LRRRDLCAFNRYGKGKISKSRSIRADLRRPKSLGSNLRYRNPRRLKRRRLKAQILPLKRQHEILLKFHLLIPRAIYKISPSPRSEICGLGSARLFAVLLKSIRSSVLCTLHGRRESANLKISKPFKFNRSRQS